MNEDGSEEQELEVKFCLFSQTKYFFAKVAVRPAQYFAGQTNPSKFAGLVEKKGRQA